LEARLQAEPTLELWHQARRLHEAADPSVLSPRLERLLGLASVVCHPPGSDSYADGCRRLELSAARFDEEGAAEEAAVSRLILAASGEPRLAVRELRRASRLLPDPSGFADWRLLAEDAQRLQRTLERSHEADLRPS